MKRRFLVLLMRFILYSFCLSTIGASATSGSFFGGSDNISTFSNNDDSNQWNLTADKKKRKFADSFGAQEDSLQTFVDGEESVDEDDRSRVDENTREDDIQNIGISGGQVYGEADQYPEDYDDPVETSRCGKDLYQGEKDCCSEKSDCCKKPEIPECCIGKSNVSKKRGYSEELTEPLDGMIADNAAKATNPTTNTSFRWRGFDGEFELGCHRDEYTLPPFAGDIICTASRCTETRVVDLFLIAIKLLEDQVELVMVDPTISWVDPDLMDRVQRFGAALDPHMILTGIVWDNNLSLRKALNSAWYSTLVVAEPVGGHAITVESVLGDREYIDLQFEFQNVDNHPILPSDTHIGLQDGIYHREVRIGIRIPMDPKDNVTLYPFDGASLEEGRHSNMLSKIKEMRVLVSYLALEAPYQSELGSQVAERVKILWNLDEYSHLHF